MSTHVRERLGEYLDGEIASEERAAISRHLRECPDCRLLLEELTAVDDAARSLLVQAPEGYFETFAPRVRARLRPATRRAFRPPVWSLALAAALLLAVITPLTLRERPASAPTSVAERAAAPPALRDRAPSPDAAPLGQAVPRSLEPASDAPVGTFAGAPATHEARSEGAVQEAKDGAQPRRKEEGAPAATKNLAAVPPEQGPVQSAGAPPPAPAKAQASAEPEGAKRPAAGVATFYCDGCDASPSPQLTARQAAEELDATSVSTASSEAKPRALAKGRLAPGAAAGAVGTDRLSAAGEARYRTLRSRAPATAEEARELRLEWRAFAESPLGRAHADDALVAAIEAAAQAYRFSASAEDRATAAADARAYLDRSDAPQAERVRALLGTLSDAP